MILDHSDDNSADAYDVRLGSKADLGARLPNVCFHPSNGHRNRTSGIAKYGTRRMLADEATKQLDFR